jgi:hypothetical protein
MPLFSLLLFSVGPTVQFHEVRRITYGSALSGLRFAAAFSQLGGPPTPELFSVGPTLQFSEVRRITYGCALSGLRFAATFSQLAGPPTPEMFEFILFFNQLKKRLM